MRRHTDAPDRTAPDDGWWFRDAVARLPELHPDRPVLVVTAPPGSGRARLVRRWLRPVPVWSWIHLPRDARDSSGGDEQVGATRVSEDVEREIERHAERHRSGFVVLEGTETLLPDELERIVLSRPTGLRLVLIGRGDGLPPALAVRLAGQVAQVQAPDLWWPAEMVQPQLAALTGTRVDIARAERIHRGSGGWPAAVLALSRAGGARPVLPTQPGPREPDRTASPSRASSSLIVLPDLTAGLALRGIPGDLADFVLATTAAPGPAPDPDLCAALVPGSNPAVLLDTARRWGLMADQWPGGPGERDRFHPLIAAAARHQAARQDRPVSENISRAGDVASGLGLGSRAVECYLAARNWPRALAELERAAPHGFRGWEMPCLHAVLARIPEPAWSGDPDRRALVALAAAFTGDQLLATEALGPTPDPAVAGLVAALGGAPCSFEKGTIPAFFGLKDNDAGLHVLAARTAVLAGEPAEAARNLAEAWAIGVNRLPRHFLLVGLGVEALAAAWSGELSTARRLAERARRLAGQAGLDGHPMLALTVLAEAEVLRARGEPGQALRVLDESAGILDVGFVAGPGGVLPQHQAHRVLRVRLLLDQGDRAAGNREPGGTPRDPWSPARDELTRVATDGDEHLPATLAVRLALARARLAELDGDLAGAQNALETARPVTAPVAQARLFLALHRQDEDRARAVLAGWPSDGGLDDRLRRLLAEAALALATGLRGPASDLVNEALLAAEPDGHLRVFLDPPAAVRTLISTTLRRSPDASQWRRSLIGRLDEAGAAGESTAGVTRRELVVLERLTTDLTHAQIAAGLFVSENTLKSHCRNLYRKLGVHSREEAVRIARVRGWLSPPGGPVIDVNITRTPDVVEL